MFRVNKFERLTHKAQKQIEKHEFVKAKNTYLECLSIKANDIGTLNNLAQIHNILNDHKKAKSYNEIVLKECKKQEHYFEKEDLLIFKINALMSLKRKDEANEYIEELLKITPDNTIALFYKVSYLDEKKEYKECLKYIDKILIQDPYNIQALLLKIKSLIILKDYDKAERFLNRVFEMDPKNKVAINLKSEMLKTRFDITLTPHDLMLKALHHREMGDYETSEDYLKKALDINQKYEEIWFVQAELYLKMGKITKAIKSFEKAFELNPKIGGIVKKKSFFRALKLIKIFNKIFRLEK